MTARARLIVCLFVTFCVALGPFTISTIYVHTHHHQTSGPKAGENGVQP